MTFDSMTFGIMTNISLTIVSESYTRSSKTNRISSFIESNSQFHFPAGRPKYLDLNPRPLLPALKYKG